LKQKKNKKFCLYLREFFYFKGKVDKKTKTDLGIHTERMILLKNLKF